MPKKKPPTVSEAIIKKATLPTHLSSDEIKFTWSQKIKEQSVFSAKTTNDEYLQTVRKVLKDLSAGDTNQALAREEMTLRLKSLGIDLNKTAGEINPIIRMQDIANPLRMELILKTNVGTAQSMAMQATNDNPVVHATYPAWELRSGEYRQTHRKWRKRWQEAGAHIGWKGASQAKMIALTDSPIWQALGQGAGGYRDTLGNPYPPFAFNSSYSWARVDRQTCKDLGLI